MKEARRTTQLGAIGVVDLRDRHFLPFRCFQQVPLVVVLDVVEMVRLDQIVSYRYTRRPPGDLQ